MKGTKKFQVILSEWSKNNLREFPWRARKTNAYQILVAEMLLKRTTAKAAATVYPKLIKKFL